jgi:hypothetical protein
MITQTEIDGIQHDVYRAEIIGLCSIPYMNSRGVLVRLDDGKITPIPVRDDNTGKVGDEMFVAIPANSFWIKAEESDDSRSDPNP